MGLLGSAINREVEQMKASEPSPDRHRTRRHWRLVRGTYKGTPMDFLILLLNSNSTWKLHLPGVRVERYFAYSQGGGLKAHEAVKPITDAFLAILIFASLV